MHISARRLLVAAVSTFAVAALVAPAAAHAAPPSPTAPAGHVGGMVPVHGAARTGSLSSGSNMSYHNGPVMHTNKVYAIYWAPGGSYTVSSNYEKYVNQFFSDVAAASSTTTNVYAIDSQYYDTLGHIAYSASFGGYYTDTDPLPNSGCTDSYTSVCLTDAQIQTELKSFMNANGLAAGPTTMYFMLTAKGIGSCSGSSCAFSQYCAYHGYSGSGSNELVYANMPYALTVPSACNSNQSPNGYIDADAEINILSHEHNEAITDENLNAWYDRRGYEIGDKCAWNFGTATGPAGQEYNQTINGDKYYVQQEWSNKVSGCALQA
ncbi:MAG TPA: hypothetical protein VFH58_12395 [Acidimicrobiales bacterium]|nr:hypothetical protein [Acidimicrobiales bacterium]